MNFGSPSCTFDQTRKSFSYCQQNLKSIDFQLSDDLGEIDENGDYWDYFEDNEIEFKDSKTSKKAQRLRAKVLGKFSKPLNEASFFMH